MKSKREKWVPPLLAGCLLVMLILSGCTITSEQVNDPNEGRASAHPDEQPEEDTEILPEQLQKDLPLTDYATKVGATIETPEQQSFETDSSFTITGAIEHYDQLHTPHVWIEIETLEQEESVNGGNTFSYWTSLDEDRFEQDIQLFSGEGAYTVSIRAPAIESDKDEYFNIAQLHVEYTHEDINRDIEYTPVGHNLGIHFTRPQTGYEQAEGTYTISGSLDQPTSTDLMMLRIQHDEESWDTVIDVSDQQFEYEIPLLYGVVPHHVEILLPDEEGEQFFPGANFILDNQQEMVFTELERYQGYYERGVNLAFPHEAVPLHHEGQKQRIHGSIDPDHPRADELTHVIIQTIYEDEKEATYYIPVEDGQFDDEIYFRFGEGSYEITVNVPALEGIEDLSFFQFEGLLSYTQQVTGAADERSLLPSRGIEADHPNIHNLSDEITAGIKQEREQAKAIYRWVAENIAYDVDKYEQNLFELDDSAMRTLEQRKGVCQDYAFLTVALLRASGIEANFVEGDVKQGGNRERHAWVEANLDGKWVEMDPTWGAGYVADGAFVFHYNADFFDPDPAFLSQTHERTGTMY